jgi:hypothetical protein
MMVVMPRPIVRRKCAQIECAQTISAGRRLVGVTQRKKEGYF